MRILLLEDSPEARDAIAAMAAALGHEVETAPDGAAGLERIRSSAPPDLVLTSVMVPVLDGISLLIETRRTRPEIPVIAMTARRDSNYLRTAAMLGAGATLFKPFSLAELRTALASSIKET